jgi:methylated-DNA-[protein]-cysteine S-methyltransferase
MQESSLVAKGTVTTWAGTTRVIAVAAGVRHIWLPDWHHPERHPETEGMASSIVIEQGGSASAEAHLRQALTELADFFQGTRRVFTVALDPQGTDFYQAVWEAVRQVPFGATRTYLDIAHVLGKPEAVRAVGSANGANPLAPIVPCHRIVGSAGTLTGYGPGLPLKQRLLVMEGVLPDATESVVAWCARISPAAPLYLGLRAKGVACRPSCPLAERHRERAPCLFPSLAAATAAGFVPCPTCRPERPSLLETGQLF